MDVALLRALAAGAGISTIGPHGGETVLQYSAEAKPNAGALLEVLQKTNLDARLAASTPPSIRIRLRNGSTKETMEKLYPFIRELSVCMR